jgi:hypothetical protein
MLGFQLPKSRVPGLMLIKDVAIEILFLPFYLKFFQFMCESIAEEEKKTKSYKAMVAIKKTLEHHFS